MSGPKQAQPRLAWHYTPGINFEPIVAAGGLRPKSSVTPAGERPILWFSTARHWEPTAQKASNAGELMGMAGTYALGGGLIRFGLRKSLLVAWPKLGRRAGMGRPMIESLEAVGRQQGANPSQWFGSLKRVRLSDVVIEVFDGADDWERISIAQHGGNQP